LFQNSQPYFGQGGPASALSISQSVPQNLPAPDSWAERWRAISDWADHVDWAPDLGTDIGSLTWLRGVVSCAMLCATAIVLAPRLEPLQAYSAPAVSGDAWEETRALSIAPLAWGSDTGRRMAANDRVMPLGESPERPTLDLTATLGQGDGFARVLERAGVGGGEAAQVSNLVGSVTPLADIKPGTVMKLILGRRVKKNDARPLDALAFRARLDMSLTLLRQGGKLQIVQTPIAVDRTPLRIQGRVGDSLYRTARANGAPPTAVEAYIRAIASKLSLSNDVGADSRFDIIVEQARAATGEIEYGNLLFAGITNGSRATQLLQWTVGGRTEWFEATGVGERRGGMTQPVEGARKTSGYGMRFHPILGYNRFHQGVDFGAAYGSAIRAVTDGVVASAGPHGGNGNMIKLNHTGNLATSYSHLSRIAVSAGNRVLQGEVIGYVGSTGLSTGPHLHFETYRGGVVVNPSTVSFSEAALLAGQELANFKARLAGLLTVPVAGEVPQPAAGGVTQ
jgi:murein DD-endopeptidase MepM/ murein hydrolase activator NlpD